MKTKLRLAAERAFVNRASWWMHEATDKDVFDFLVTRCWDDELDGLLSGEETAYGLLLVAEAVR